MLEEQSYDESVDWWLLGVMLYRLLTGTVSLFLQKLLSFSTLFILLVVALPINLTYCFSDYKRSRTDGSASLYGYSRQSVLLTLNVFIAVNLIHKEQKGKTGHLQNGKTISCTTARLSCNFNLEQIHLTDKIESKIFTKRILTLSKIV